MKSHRKITPETYSPSKAVAQNLGEEVRLDHPYHNETRKKKEVASKTDWRRMSKIAHEKLK